VLDFGTNFVKLIDIGRVLDSSLRDGYFGSRPAQGTPMDLRMRSAGVAVIARPASPFPRKEGIVYRPTR
jgi:hypothetical protein